MPSSLPPISREGGWGATFVAEIVKERKKEEGLHDKTSVLPKKGPCRLHTTKELGIRLRGRKGN